MEPAYTVERTYPVPMAKLWHACTNGVALESWYHGIEHRCVVGSVTGDAVAGQIWSVGIDVPQHNVQVYFYGTYEKVVPQQQIVHTMHYTVSADEFAIKDMTTPAHKVIMDFEERPEGSFVRFAQYGYLPPEQIPATKAGMGSYFDSLGNYLAQA